MAAWTPEIAVDRALASRLIASQFPEVDLGSLELIGEGWDNTIWLVDGHWVFRFPRREVALPGFLRELDVLPRIAPLVTAPVPIPVFRGEPTEGFPWPFSGAALIPGDELGRVPRDEIVLARDLGGFLRTLHDLDVSLELPIDPNGRTDMARRVPMARDALAALQSLGLWSPPSLVDELLESAIDLRTAGAPGHRTRRPPLSARPRRR